MSAHLQAEQIVLGSLLHGDAAASCAAAGLTAEAFGHPAHRDLYWRLVVGHFQLEDAADLIATLSARQSAAMPLSIGRASA